MIRKFVSGDYGLAKTYWFGLLALLGASLAGFLVVLAGYEWDWVIHRAFRLECVSFVLPWKYASGDGAMPALPYASAVGEHPPAEGSCA